VGTVFSPLDAELGLLPNHRFSPRVEALAARLGSTVPFADAAQVVDLAVGVQLSPATLRRQTYAAGAAALVVEQAALDTALTTPTVHPAPPALLQLSIDATKVPLLHGAWTDVKLAVFADLTPGPATESGQPTHQPGTHSYVARWEPAERFGQTLTLEGQHRGLDEAGVVVSPNDGADWIQGVLDLLAPQAIRILDFPHAVEHLGTIATLVAGAGTPAATTWATAQRTVLAQQGADALLAALAVAQTQGPCATALPDADDQSPEEQLAREVAYFTKRAPQLAYPTFQAAGYPSGSGLVESGHKVVIGPRFKGAGQHWASQHLNPLLVLRCASCNDRWPAMWTTAWAQQWQQTWQARRSAQQRRRAMRLTLLPAPAPTAPSPAPPPPNSTTAPPPRPKLVVDGHPTADHPWRHFTLHPRRRAVG
jgi:hypothetical protein